MGRWHAGDRGDFAFTLATMTDQDLDIPVTRRAGYNLISGYES